MILEQKPMRNLAMEDVLSLITNKVSESRMLDYKETLPGNSDAQKREFLCDVSSFANTVGGFLVFGIKEEEGIPLGLSGLLVQDEDELILRLENMVRDGIEPRIPNIFTRCFSDSGVGSIVIMHIPKSPVGPHMVTFQRHGWFYLRESRGKHPMDVNELRRAFKSLEATDQQIAGFKSERILKISQGVTPVKIFDSAKVILHLIPYTMNDESFTYDLGKLRNQIHQIRPLYTFSGWSDKYNLDGIVTFEGPNLPTHTYLQVFRNGVIEAVSTGLLNQLPEQNVPKIASELLERELIGGFKQYNSIQQLLGINPPYKVAITLMGVRGYSMAFDMWKHGAVGLIHAMTHDPLIDLDLLSIPEVTVNSENEEADVILKPIFDHLWNAAGWPHSLNYDSNGRWNPN